MAEAYPSGVRAFLLEQVPDEAVNVDLRGILLAKDVEILPDVEGAPGYAVYAPDIDLACLWGTPDAETIAALAPRFRRGTQVVCEGALRADLEEQVDAVHAEPIHFYAFPDGATPNVPPETEEGQVRIVDASDDVLLDHLPEGLRNEMNTALLRTFVAMTFVDDQPVAFCYPHHETEAFWDVSVDTLDAHRRQGHAARAFGVAHELMTARGKTPVWGSLDSNAASNGLARRLGMEPIATNYVLIAAGSSDRS